MRVAISADHAGYHLKQDLLGRLTDAGHAVTDLGTHSEDPVDYPDYAAAVGRAVLEGRSDRGLVVCGSGAGAAIAANKLAGIRAALCHDAYSARQSVEHDDANVLCLGSRVVGPELAWVLAVEFLDANFSGEERHVRRVGKIADLERQQRAGISPLKSSGLGPYEIHQLPSALSLGPPIHEPCAHQPTGGRL